MTAPVKAGTSAGKALISLNGKEIGQVELLCGESVMPALPKPMSLFHRLKSALGG
jgi:D-alanyl-D-alanine carboxypeptidase